MRWLTARLHHDDEARNSNVEDLLRREGSSMDAYPGRFAAVAMLNPRDDGSVDQLETLAKQGPFKGIRLHCRSRLLGTDPIALWRRALDLDMVVSAAGNIVENFSEGLGSILQELPKLRVKIEHLARPDLIEQTPHPRWR